MIIGGVLKKNFKNTDVKLIKDINNSLLLKSDVVILSLYSTLHIVDKNIKNLTEVLKNKNKNIKIYVGGPVSAYPSIILKELNVDGVILGEGELTITDIIKGSSDEGLAYLENDEIVINPNRKLPDLESEDILIPKDIGSQNIRGANIYLETHRGCLGHCTFCQVPKFFGRNIRSKPLEVIIDQVKKLKKYGVKKVAVSGGTGSLYNFKKKLNKDMFLDLIEKLSSILGKNNLSIPDMRVDYVDEDILNGIRDYTIGWVFYGIESGSDKILKDMKKGVSVEKNLNAIKLCRDCNVKVGGSFIVGYPTETETDYLLTKDFIVDAELDSVFVSIAEPIPTTELCDLVLKTPIDKNPSFIRDKGKYGRLGLTISEGRCLDLSIHGNMWKPNPVIITKKLFHTYYIESKKQGEDIRKITNLIYKYKSHLCENGF